MKKETKKRCLCLLALAVLCLSGVFCVQIKAEDAFVVEEEAIIGGDAWQGATPEVAPESPQPEHPAEEQDKHEVSAPVSSAITKNSKKAESGDSAKKKSEQEAVTVSPDSISENSVSQNKIVKSSASPIFRVPDGKQNAFGETEDSLRTEVPQTQLQKKNPWWLLVISAAFFLAGCARLVWRRRERRKKDVLYV